MLQRSKFLFMAHPLVVFLEPQTFDALSWMLIYLFRQSNLFIFVDEQKREREPGSFLGLPVWNQVPKGRDARPICA